VRAVVPSLAVALALGGTPGVGMHRATADEDAGELVERARRLYTEEGPAAALPAFERALARSRASGDRRLEAIALGLIGNCHKRLGDLDRALDHLRRSLAMKRELGDRLEEGKTLSHLGLVFWERGEYAEATEHLDLSLAIARELGDRQLEGASLNNLSLVYDEQGDYRRSLEQYETALALHRATGFAEGESATLGNIGGVHLLLGRYREALSYYEQAFEISEKLGLKASMSQDLGNIAHCQLGLGRLEPALRSFESALALAREVGLRKEEADWQKGKAHVLLRRARYAAAWHTYADALSAYEQAGLRREEIEALNEVGHLYALVGDAAAAELRFRRALQLSAEIGHPRGVMSNLFALGDLERGWGRLEEAEALYRNALERARQARDSAAAGEGLLQLASTHRRLGRLAEARDEAQQALAVGREIEAPAVQARAYHALGEIAHGGGDSRAALGHYSSAAAALSHSEEPELEWRLAFSRGEALEALSRLDKAVAAYERAVSIIEDVRENLRDERFRAGYIQDRHHVYVALAQLLLRLRRPGEAFSCAERLRARAFRHMLSRAPASLEDADGDEEEAQLLERISRLRRSIEQEESQPPAERRAQAVSLFREELAAAQRAYAKRLAERRRLNPDGETADAPVVPELELLRAALPESTVLLEYLVGDATLTVFVLRRDGIEAAQLPIGAAELEAKVELFRDLVVRADSDDWQASADSLRRALIADLEKRGWLRGARRLLIVPHGVLHYVPYAALCQRTASGLRFLVDDYELAYLPSAAALVRDPDPARGEGALLALAPGRARLRHSRAEVRDLADAVAGASLILDGRRATESAFKRWAGQYALLHLATHGSFNKSNPLFSSLELEPEGEEDGQLHVYEVLSLRLRADLVTLSACQTALGAGDLADTPAGDEFLGLTRAFLSAGASSVLASLWEVDDRSTAQLMRRFYADLSGRTKAEALARAQRGLREAGGRSAHPAWWAAFVLMGNGR